MEKAKKKIRPDAVLASSFFTISAIMLLCIVFYKITGAEGAGYMSAPIALFLFSYGALVIPFESVTRDMVKSHISRGKVNDVKKNFHKILLVSFVTGLILSLICAAFSGIFSNAVFHSTRNFYVLFMIVPMILFVSVQGVFRGYLSGAGFMASSLVSNFIIVGMSYILSITFSGIAYSYGKRINALMHVDDIASAYGAIGAALGVSISCFVSLLFIIIMYLIHKKEIEEVTDTSKGQMNAGNWEFAIDIIPNSLLFCQGGLLLFIDECVYLGIANKLHPDENNIENWGVYLAQCVAIASVLAFTLSIPFMKSWYGTFFSIVKRNFKSARIKIEALFHFESMLFLPVVIMVMVLSRTITNIIFGKTNDAAVNMIAFTVPVILPGALLLFIMFLFVRLKNYILIGVNATVGTIVHIVSLIICTKLAKLGIHSSIVAFDAGILVMTIFAFFELKVMFDLKMDILRDIVKPAIAAGISGILCLIINNMLVNLIGEILTFIIASVLSYILYMVLIIVLKAADKYEIEKMPFGDQFAVLADRIANR